MKNDTALDRIKDMLSDIQQHKRPKNTLLQIYITERLNKSMSVYYKQLLTSSETLKYKNERRVMYKLTK